MTFNFYAANFMQCTIGRTIDNIQISVRILQSFIDFKNQ